MPPCPPVHPTVVYTNISTEFQAPLVKWVIRQHLLLWSHCWWWASECKWHNAVWFPPWQSAINCVGSEVFIVNAAGERSAPEPILWLCVSWLAFFESQSTDCHNVLLWGTVLYSPDLSLELPLINCLSRQEPAVCLCVRPGPPVKKRKHPQKHPF